MYYFSTTVVGLVHFKSDKTETLVIRCCKKKKKINKSFHQLMCATCS